MKVFFDMVGCRLNQAEIDLMAMKHISMGNTVVSKAVEADCVFVNTCCVTKKAAADSRKKIRAYQRDTNAKVIAMGCWPSAMLDDALEIVEPESIINNDEKFYLLNYSSLNLGTVEKKPILGDRQRTRSFVKVQDGCLNQCSFCLTTIARGKSRSEELESVVQYIRKLEDLDVKEIVLTGVQLGSWGKDLPQRMSLANLLDQIILKTNIPRIRLSSIEPWDVSDELIQLFNEPRICSHLHIPIQSASDDMLKAMRRPSSSEKLYKLFEALHKKAPGVALTTDIIVGFPNESEEDFQQTLRFAKEAGLTGGHVFSFSPMPGTTAETLNGQIQASIVKDRNKTLRMLLSELSHQYLYSRLKSNAKVLFESRLRIDDKMFWSGLSEDMIRVLVPAEANLKNNIYTVELQSISTNNRITGQLISS